MEWDGPKIKLKSWDEESEDILRQLEEDGDGGFSNCEMNEEELDIMLSDLEMEYGE